MAIDGILLHALTESLQPLVNGKIGKIQNLSEEEILFHIHTKSGMQKLVINFHSNSNRLYLSTGLVYPQPEPTSFVMFLRKHLSQGIVAEIRQMGYDRVCRITVQTRTELGDRKPVHLYCELMGKYANLVVTDEHDRILDAGKRIPVYENSKRLLAAGAKYVLPVQPEKTDPDKVTQDTPIDPDKSLVAQISGFSPALAAAVSARMETESLPDLLHQVLASRTLYYANDKQFHLIPLEAGLQYTAFPLMEGIEQLYRSKEEESRRKEQFRDLIRTVRNELAKLEKKLPKLEDALEKSRDYDQYRKYGDLLFSSPAVRGRKAVVTDWETGSDITIPLDEKLDIKQNANRYYAKYHKLKRSIEILQEQIAQCKEDIVYFRQLEEQLKHCTPADAREIRQELAAGRYLFDKTRKPTRKKTKPNHLTIRAGDAVILVGKNNLQNNYVTFKAADRKDLWFHVQDYHGSHVILQSESPTEEQIRAAAMLAAWFSKGQHSSSVPVDYTPVYQLKKVPGSKAGFVTMKSRKTIYIDPDEAVISSLLKKAK